MKNAFNLCLYLFLILMVFIACTTEPEDQVEMNLTIRILGNPQCNNSKSAQIANQIHDSQSCLEYAFDQDNQILILKHLNAAFNCCPDSLWCTVTYRNDTIVIQEFEKNKGCKCDCLYDLDIEIDGVEPGKYHIELVEPYALNQDQLCLEIDIPAKNQGIWCVPRTNYPW